MSKNNSFHGIFPAVITPFSANLEVDYEGLSSLLRGMLDKRVAGFLINGSTGEAATLTKEERVTNIQTASKIANGRAKVLAGVGSPATSQAIDFAQDAEKAGADAVVALTPYDIIPNQQGLLEYYRKIARSVSLPVIAYNLPQHTGVNLQVETVAKLAEEQVISGIKESSGNLSVFAQMVQELGDKISILTGGDDLTLPSFVLGCSGAIVALGNIAPEYCIKIFESVQQGDIQMARQLYYKLLPIAQAIGSPENFPAPIKEALSIMQKPAGPCRSPVVRVSQEESKKIRAALQFADLARLQTPVEAISKT